MRDNGTVLEGKKIRDTKGLLMSRNAGAGKHGTKPRLGVMAPMLGAMSVNGPTMITGEYREHLLDDMSCEVISFSL